MKTKYTDAFKIDIVQKYESISPKPKQKDFAEEHQINLNSFRMWLNEFRERKQEFGIVELNTKKNPKQDSKVSVHISLQNGVNIETVLDENQFFDLIWQRK